MSKTNYKIVYKSEHLLSSILADTFSFGVIVTAFWLNYKFIDGNNWLDTLLFISFFLFSMGKAVNVKRHVEMMKEDQDLFESEDKR